MARWHREGSNLLWHRGSLPRLGRPRLDVETREPIAVMSHDHPCWGAERIAGSLRKLGIVDSNRSIRRYRGRSSPRPTAR